MVRVQSTASEAKYNAQTLSTDRSAGCVRFFSAQAGVKYFLVCLISTNRTCGSVFCLICYIGQLAILLLGTGTAPSSVAYCG